jgi:hypothetical protein
MPRSNSSRVLEDNARLFGPVKLVSRPERDPICRADVPETLTGDCGGAMCAGGELQILNAASRWAAALTACVTGEHEMVQWDAELERSAADELKQAGWSASLDNERLHVHLQLPGVYRRVAFERDTKSGVKLATELVALDGLEDDCIRAIKLAANEANSRLQLVRLAISGPARNRALRAEVGFGAALIPGELLLWSLHAFETAAALCVRELEALCDRDLARLLLAAAAVRGAAT